MKRVLFVCSGNVFRSISAQVCLKDYLKRNKIKGIKVDSAGTHKPRDNHVSPFTREDLGEDGITFRHRPKKITKELIKESDIIISMGKDHKKFLKEKYEIDSPLFNKLAYGKSTSVLDLHERYPELLKFPPKERIKQKDYSGWIKEVVDQIYNGTPKLASNIIKILEI